MLGFTLLFIGAVFLYAVVSGRAGALWQALLRGSPN